MPKKIDSDYSAIIYHVFGDTGNRIFLTLYLIAIWGVLISILVNNKL